MFSGIVETVGVVAELEPRNGGLRIAIETPEIWGELEDGGSVSVNGVCLTVSSKRAPNLISLDIVPETVSRTTMGGLRKGSGVNLELPLRLSDRLGGHLVSGHIDGIGEIMAVSSEGEGKRISIRPPSECMKYIAYKGSVAVAGVSLTVAAVGPRIFEIALIPYTLQRTTLGNLEPGACVNLEMDMVAKYVERLLGKTPGE